MEIGATVGVRIRAVNGHYVPFVVGCLACEMTVLYRVLPKTSEAYRWLRDSFERIADAK
jgi:hypothetical protein